MENYQESRRVDPVVREKLSSGALSFAKVFLYMFIGLAITTAVAFGIGYIFVTALNNGASGETLSKAYLGLMISSAIILIILSLIINFSAFASRHSILFPAILYCVVMGALLSSFTIVVDWRILGMAFGITSGIFLLMSLIAIFTKGNLSPLAMLGIGLISGCLILALVNFFLRSNTLAWVISFALFAAVMFITMFDIWNIKKICERGEMSNNLSLYCAFSLYVDFIYILIRIIIFLVAIFGNRN